jgi:hypothetical protein
VRQQLLPKQVENPHSPNICRQPNSDKKKQLKGVISENFEFCGTRIGTRVITRNMAEFQFANLTSTAKTCPTPPYLKSP